MFFNSSSHSTTAHTCRFSWNLAHLLSPQKDFLLSSGFSFLCIYCPHREVVSAVAQYKTKKNLWPELFCSSHVYNNLHGSWTFIPSPVVAKTVNSKPDRLGSHGWLNIRNVQSFCYLSNVDMWLAKEEEALFFLPWKRANHKQGGSGVPPPAVGEWEWHCYFSLIWHK